MITALDTGVLVDVISQDHRAQDTMATAAQQGQLIIGEIVFAELCAGMPLEDLETFCDDFGISYVPSSHQALGLAGSTWQQYRSRSKGPRERMVADFMIASHAQIHANRLLTTDRGFYRDYFKHLNLLSYLK